jgi:hypothetical protein
MTSAMKSSSLMPITESGNAVFAAVGRERA